MQYDVCILQYHTEHNNNIMLLLYYELLRVATIRLSISQKQITKVRGDKGWPTLRTGQLQLLNEVIAVAVRFDHLEICGSTRRTADMTLRAKANIL